MRPVLLDASVLYPSLCRNVLLHMAEHGLIAARWTAEIHDEWTRNLLTKQPELSAKRVQRTRSLMEAAVPDAAVTGYEELIPRLTLPDPDDRHVLAAAIAAQAEAVVTFNLRHFPASSLQPFGLVALTPDALVDQLLEEHPDRTSAALRAVQTSFQRPPYTWAEFVLRLHHSGFSKTVQQLSS